MENKAQIKKPIIKFVGPLPGDKYYSSSDEKTYIRVINTNTYTALEAINWWKQSKEEVGTPYVIDRDGTIFQLFNDSKWVHQDNGKANEILISMVLLTKVVNKGTDEKPNYIAYPHYPLEIGKIPLPKKDIVKIGSQFVQQVTEEQKIAVDALILWLEQKYQFPELEKSKKVKK